MTKDLGYDYNRPWKTKNPYYVEPNQTLKAKKFCKAPAVGNATGNANSGDGGGGNDHAAGANAVGRSGVVILKYPNTSTLTIGSGLTSSTATSGDFKITTFTAGTDNISIN